MLSKKRKKEIEKLAEEAHEIVMPGSVDNENLGTYLTTMGIQVFVNDLSVQKLNGLLTFDPDCKQPVIVINEKQPIKAMFFSMAHEIGHLILEWHMSLLDSEWPANCFDDENCTTEATDSNRQLVRTSYQKKRGAASTESEPEEESDYFALCFLLPRALCLSYLKKYGRADRFYSDTIHGLSVHFAVEESVARKRLDEFARRGLYTWC